VFDEVALAELGCGGLLGVNGGSAEPPRMVKATYRPDGAGPDTPHLSIVGKGIMYDSGGISLKPGDAVHATMKNDMSGAAAVVGALSALRAVGCPTAVTAYLMCTDNMPSGTAMALGDVLTVRGGTTVEVINTDAEGRLVMADALVLATEEPTDAIVDIATLTGACMRALGTQVGGVMGNHQGLIDQIRACADRTDEPLWQLPGTALPVRAGLRRGGSQEPGRSQRRRHPRRARPRRVRGRGAVGPRRHRRHRPGRRPGGLAPPGVHGRRGPSAGGPGRAVHQAVTVRR
jgi:leucyl aminopeptidase